MTRALGVPVRREELGLARFDVLVDGEVIARRARGAARRTADGGWPDPDDVVDAIAARLGGAGRQPR